MRQRRQQHLLDVKVRSRRATQHRIRRVIGVLSRVILLVALCAAAYAGVREAARRLFFENPDYQLKTIELQTDGTLQREQVLKEADLREGENIFKVNLARVHVKQKKLLPEYLGLPLILGCSSEALEAGKVVESSEAKTALELLRLSARSFLQMRFQIREIDVSKGYCLLVTDKNHARVTFGFNDLETQLRRLEHFLVYCDDSKQELGTVNLLVQRNIPVTFAERAVAVINDTIEPAVEPRIMKAIPVQAREKPAPSAPKPRADSKPLPRAIPSQRKKTD